VYSGCNHREEKLQTSDEPVSPQLQGNPHSTTNISPSESPNNREIKAMLPEMPSTSKPEQKAMAECDDRNALWCQVKLHQTRRHRSFETAEGKQIQRCIQPSTFYGRKIKGNNGHCQEQFKGCDTKLLAIQGDFNHVSQTR
jgi:hypothetical protein